MTIFWFRRDFNIFENIGLYYALKENTEVLPIFIFDKNILEKLDNKTDARVNFIYSEILKFNLELNSINSFISVYYDNPIEVFKYLINKYNIKNVYTNEDYEPYAIERDNIVEIFLNENNIEFKKYKNQVLFAKSDILKDNNLPYSVFTPYSKKWLKIFNQNNIKLYNTKPFFNSFIKKTEPINISLKTIGFIEKKYSFPAKEIDIDKIKNYDKTRDFPYLDATSKLGLHLRFGTVSIRQLIEIANNNNQTYLNELIWREFYFMIIYHFPNSATKCFKTEYENLEFINNENHFDAWCKGETGFLFVDAGMRQLNETGFIHNRLRMLCATFLTKFLLIDWRWGEAYFAEKLLDYELSSNVGGWQWAASTGNDAVPYFRIFNPETQMIKFDKNLEFCKKYVPEFKNSLIYKTPIVDYNYARNRALETYKKARNIILS